MEESNGLIVTVLMIMVTPVLMMSIMWKIDFLVQIPSHLKNMNETLDIPRRFLASPATKDSSGCSSEASPRVETTVKGERPGAGLREEGPANLCIKRGEFWVFRGQFSSTSFQVRSFL